MGATRGADAGAGAGAGAEAAAALRPLRTGGTTAAAAAAGADCATEWTAALHGGGTGTIIDARSVSAALRFFGAGGGGIGGRQIERHFDSPLAAVDARVERSETEPIAFFVDGSSPGFTQGLAGRVQGLAILGSGFGACGGLRARRG